MPNNNHPSDLAIARAFYEYRITAHYSVAPMIQDIENLARKLDASQPAESPKNEGLPELLTKWRAIAHQLRYCPGGMPYTADRLEDCASDLEAALAREASREGVGPKWYAGTQRPEPMTSDDTGCTTGLILFLSQPEDGGPTARQGVFDHCMRFFIDSATGKRADPDMWCFSPDATPPVPQRLAQGEVKGLAERVAIAIWHRWGDADRLTWEDEPEKVAFRDAAAEVIEIVAAALGAAKPQGAGNAVIEELRSILADAQAGGPPVGRGGYCLDCGKWTPKNHREAEDHKEDCMAAAEWDKRLKWRARLQTLIAATPQDEAKPQALGGVCSNCERLTDIHHCQACGADFTVVGRPRAAEFVLVPKEPTADMVSAWRENVPDDSCQYNANNENWSEWCRESWTAMLAAAAKTSGGEDNG